MDISQIAKALGRSNIAKECDVSRGAVDGAVNRGQFPSGWEKVINWMCDQAGLPHPGSDMFTFKQPSVNSGGPDYGEADSSLACSQEPDGAGKPTNQGFST